MQHFLLTLECGHVFEVSAVDEIQLMEKDGDGKRVVKTVPYQPDYTGREMPSRCIPAACKGPWNVKEQKKIPRLTGREY